MATAPLGHDVQGVVVGRIRTSSTTRVLEGQGADETITVVATLATPNNVTLRQTRGSMVAIDAVIEPAIGRDGESSPRAVSGLREQASW